MIKRILPFLIFVFISFNVGCTPKTPESIDLLGDSISQQMMNLEQVAITTYRLQQVNAVVSGRFNNKSDAEIKADLSVIREKWQVVWSLIEESEELRKDLKALVNSYFQIKEDGGNPDPSEMIEIIKRISDVYAKTSAVLKTLNPG